ncbi:SEC-C metal-binding domain-containing protein [Ferrimicrobium sp.]|uniref:SEC-C metal-binding domain-containing protein n=1 Tax=Ferrimicrobium sp. TaxID=2926050 RepID=UPI00261DEF2D|nr:SEC-C metal-binding domain-containing protein [Ferrimicrobium sp.]
MRAQIFGSVNEMEFDDELINAVLEELGSDSLPIGVLAARLRDRKDLTSLAEISGEELTEILREELASTGEFWLSANGMVIALAVMLDGIWLSHWVTSFELEHGALEAFPDLALIDCDLVDNIPLAGGGELSFEAGSDLDFVEDEDAERKFFYSGGPDWLRSIDEPSLAVLSRRDGVIAIGLSEHIGDGVREEEAIRQAFDEISEAGEPLDCIELLLEVLARDPTLFRTPVPPITDLCERAGLRAIGSVVYLAGDEPSANGMVRNTIAQQFGFDRCCETAFTEVLVYLLGALADDDSADDDDTSGDDDDEQLGRVILGHLAHESVAPALGDTILEDSDERSPILDAFLAKLSAAGLESAQTHYLQALNLERDGAVVEAQQELEMAVRLDPWYRPALEELAWYVSDSGDLRRADGLYARAGIDEDEPERAYLQDLLSQPFRGVGRNDPCPCGSGRKYKQCCLGDGTRPIERRIGLLYQKIVTFALRPQNQDLARPIMETLDDSEVEALRGATLPLLIDLMAMSTEMVERFLSTRGMLLPADERQLVREWVGIGPSLWQVVTIDRDTSITMLDTISGLSRVVQERSMASEISVGDYLYVRVVPAGTGFQIIGIPLRLSAIQRETLLGTLSTGGGPIELAAWISSMATPVEMRTFDDEKIVFCESVLVPQTTSWEEMIPVFDELFERVQGERWHVIDQSASHGMVRGWLERVDDRLVVTTNAVEREETILGMLMGAFEDLEIVEATQRDFEEVRRDGQDVLLTPTSRGREVTEEQIASSEVQTALDTFIREREMAWLDESIPALHGLTPRQAAQDPSRREELVALLNEFDHYPTPGAGAITFDVDRLRTFLGIERDG